MAAPKKTTRKRPLPFQGWNARIDVTFSNDPARVDQYFGSSKVPGLQGTEVTQSESHPEWRKSKSFRGGDVGGEFFTQKNYTTPNRAPTVHLYGKEDLSPPVGRFMAAHYFGPLLPSDPNSMPAPSYINSGDTTLNAWGTRAIARCKPTNNVASALQAIIELYREGMPHILGHTLWKDRSRPARGAGGEYLNLEFGWKPLVSDITDFAKGVVNLDRIMKQYERDAGKVVRRRWTFPLEESVVTTVLASNVSPYTAVFHSALAVKNPPTKGQVVRTRTTTVRRWFSGAFTYYLPSDYWSRKKLREHAGLAGKLLGVELTPELLWNVTPWSWAADWFGSVGDVISNYTDWITDGLVMRYGYIMEHTRVQDVYSYHGYTGLQSSVARPIVLTRVSETKVRKSATPFGFGLLLSNLTDRQKAIISALGITKSSR